MHRLVITYSNSHSLQVLQHQTIFIAWPADPLRVLRAVRFATRFGFELEASILQAGSSNEVSAAQRYDMIWLQ